jgi:nucleotide-binding universal stress UspA family protein
VLWKQKVVKPLVVRAEEYFSGRREMIPTILVPLANPETEQSLLKVSAALAKSRNSRLRLIHVVHVPMQTPLEAGRLQYEKLRKEKESLLDLASRHASEQGIKARSSAIVAHNVSSAILSVADTENPELVIMGWRGEDRMPRIQRNTVSGVLKLAKGNVLVLKDRGLQRLNKILVPVSGGPHAHLGLKIAQELARQWRATITALNVQRGKGVSDSCSEFDRQSVELFQSEALDFVKKTLDSAGVDAEPCIILDTDIVNAIVRVAREHDIIVMGASNEWFLRRRLFGSIPDQIANQASVSVLMVRSEE